MSVLSEEVPARLEEIGQRISVLEKALQGSPDGRLRVSTSGKNVRFYLVSGPGNSSGRYLRRTEVSLAEMLAQKDHNRRALKLLKQERVLLEKLYRHYEHAVSKAVPFGEYGPSEFFSGPEELLRRQENEARKRMVMPIAPDTELFVEEWLSKTYEKKEFCDTSGLYGAEQNSGTGADPDTRNGVETDPDRYPGKHPGAISPLLKICTRYVP